MTFSLLHGKFRFDRHEFSITMLVLTLTGSLQWLADRVPRNVVREIQFGLGLSLASLALKDCMVSQQITGFMLAGMGFLISVALLGNRRYTAALFIILLDFVYDFFFELDVTQIAGGIGFTLPRLNVSSLRDILQGFLILSLPRLLTSSQKGASVKGRLGLHIRS